MFLRSFNFIFKNRFFQHQYQKQEKMFVLRQYFFGVMRNKLHWTTASETSNTKYLELIKRRSKVQEKNMSCELLYILANEKHFPKTNSQWEFDYGLFRDLPRIVKFTDFSPSSSNLKRGILPLLTKYVS